MRLKITREVCIPDLYRLELYKRAPELGPRILFFSGGTALRKSSQNIIRYTHNSIHLITPFDSGGSSAIIRKAFAMPAVGDIRNRLMALADQSVKGNPAIFDLFAYRLAKQSKQNELLGELKTMAMGKHPLVRAIPDPMRKIIRNHFHQILDFMPSEFNLKGASIGNLVLTAGYLSNRRQLDPVIYIFSKLVQVCGVVRPTINKDLHMAVRLKDGTTIVGQHLMTGKETAPLSSPIEEIWLTESLDNPAPITVPIREKMKNRISEADLICYPIGSFYSSIVVNLLPQGVGAAIAANPCPKVFIPNTGIDPECRNLSVAGRIHVIQDILNRSGAEGIGGPDFVLLDTKNGQYDGGVNIKGIRRLGVEVIDVELVTQSSAPFIDEQRLNEVLLSLA